MVASYPRAPRAFTVKRNIVDDVDASHVNDIQDEISSIETVLGNNPHTDLSINGIGRDYNNVGNRLGEVTRHTDNPYLHVGCPGVTVASGFNSAMSFSVEYGDPLKAFTPSPTSYQVTIPRNGYYLIVADALYNAEVSAVSFPWCTSTTLWRNSNIWKQRLEVIPANFTAAGIEPAGGTNKYYSYIAVTDYFYAGYYLGLGAFHNHGGNISASGHLSYMWLRD